MVSISVLSFLNSVSRFRNSYLSHKLFSLAHGRGDQCEKLGYGLSGRGYYVRRIVLNAIIGLQVCDLR